MAACKFIGAVEECCACDACPIAGTVHTVTANMDMAVSICNMLGPYGNVLPGQLPM